MHLTTEYCYEDIVGCTRRWLWKSTTSFHGYQDDWNLPIHFGICCWNYALAGIIMICLPKPKWVNRTYFPYTLFALILIFVQSPLSFQADYLHMQHDSLYHVYDRFSAIPSMLLEVWKVMSLWQFARRGKALCYTILFLFAIYSFLQSQHAQSQIDKDGFILWHTRWHLYPLLASILTLYDHYILGAEVMIVCREKTKKQQQEHQHLLLSSMLMSRSANKLSSSSMLMMKSKLQKKSH